MKQGLALVDWKVRKSHTHTHRDKVKNSNQTQHKQSTSSPKVCTITHQTMHASLVNTKISPLLVVIYIFRPRLPLEFLSQKGSHDNSSTVPDAYRRNGGKKKEKKKKYLESSILVSTAERAIVKTSRENLPRGNDYFFKFKVTSTSRKPSNENNPTKWP